MARKKFLRSGYHRYSKLGLRRKKKLIYRKAKGGENKVRLNRAGRIVKVKIGFGKKRRLRGLVNGLRPVLIKNIDELKRIGKEEIGIIAKVGDKKRKLIAEYAAKNNIRLKNLNVDNFLKSVEKKITIIKERRKFILEKRNQKNKKSDEKNIEDKKIDKLEEKVNVTKDKEEVVKNHETNVNESVEEKK